MDKIYYCYSKRLQLFLRSMNESYVETVTLNPYVHTLGRLASPIIAQEIHNARDAVNVIHEIMKELKPEFLFGLNI